MIGEKQAEKYGKPVTLQAPAEACSVWMAPSPRCCMRERRCAVMLDARPTELLAAIAGNELQ